jgi:hypothetical protein
MNERSFRFHGSQVGRAKAGFEAGGFPPFIFPDMDAFGQRTGTYIFVVMLPPSIENVDWELLDGWQQRRRRSGRLQQTLIRAGIMVAIIAAVGVGGYYAVQTAAAMGMHFPWSEPEQPKAAPVKPKPEPVKPKPEPVKPKPEPLEFFGFQLPSFFESQEAPPPAKPEAKPAEFFGFELPSFFQSEEAPAKSSLLDPITKPLEDAKNAAVTALYVFVGICVLIVLFMLRGVLGAIFGGVAGIVKAAGSLAGKGRG